MGREIRRVPSDWEHPTYEYWRNHGKISYFGAGGDDDPFPTYDKFYGDACAEWKRNFLAWENDEGGVRTEAKEEYGYDGEYWDWNGHPPQKEYYRHRNWTTEEATAYQIYETITEGTPISPVLQTEQEIVDWIVQNKNMSRDAAEQFVSDGSIPSGIIYNTSDEVIVKTGFQILDSEAEA